MLFCASYAKAQTLGAGISVDSQDNLVINAPLYVYDRYGKNPKLELAPSSINYEVYIGIFCGQSVADFPIEFKGEIKNGFLSLTINKPDESLLNDAMYFFDPTPRSYFTSGYHVQIGQLNFKTGNGKYTENDKRILIYPNRNERISFNKNVDIGTYYFDNDYCEIFYSLGEVDITGKVSVLGLYGWKGEFNIHLKKGWNIVSTRYVYDDIKGDTETRNSINLSSDAVWLLLK